MEKIEEKVETAQKVLTLLRTYIIDEYAKHPDGESRSIKSCCTFDNSTLRFDNLFGEIVSSLMLPSLPQFLYPLEAYYYIIPPVPNLSVIVNFCRMTH